MIKLKDIKLGVVLSCFLMAMPVLAANYFMPEVVCSSAYMVRQGHVQGFTPLSSVLFENPAGLHMTNRNSVSLFSTTLMNEVNYRSFSASKRVPGWGVFALGYMGLGVEGIPYINHQSFDGVESYSVSGSFSYLSQLFKMGYQFSMSDRFHLGLAGNYYRTKFDTVSGSGYNFDIGVYFDYKKVDVSYVLKNVLSSRDIKYQDTQGGSDLNKAGSSQGRMEELLLESVLSMKYDRQRWRALAQLRKVEGHSFVKNASLRYVLFDELLEVSAGYREEPLTRMINEDYITRQDVDRSFTLGVGLTLFGLNLDYALEKNLKAELRHLDFEQFHYFSLGVSL